MGGRSFVSGSLSEALPPGVRRASELPRYRTAAEIGVTAAEKPLREVVREGAGARVIELLGTAALTAAVRWTAEAQGRGEQVAWVNAREECFFPPDLAANGVDLETLPVISVREREEAVEAIDTLMRSGFFSLVVVDWKVQWPLEGALQTRFLRLGEHHGVTLLFLSEEHASRGIALVPVRIRADRRREAPGVYRLTLEIVRDKRGFGMTRQEEAAHGPPGLR
ncbi:MAG: hypothetical protein ACLFPW_00155 [Spirochaetaceae bacterium]